MNPENTDGLAQMRQVQRVLNESGYVQFDWKAGWATVVSANGVLFSAMDDRTYQGFLKTLAQDCNALRLAEPRRKTW